MSLILDALNRSQRERDNKIDVPGLETQHPVEKLPAPGLWRRWLPWSGLAAALCVIAWLLLHRNEPAIAPASHHTPEVVEPEPEPTPVPAPVPAPEAEISLREAGQAIARQASIAEAVARKAPTQNHAAIEGLYNKKQVQQPVVADEVKPAPTVAEETERKINIEEIIARAKLEVEDARLMEHSAPFLSALSQQTKNRIPTLYYSRHDYSVSPSQSSVTLNGEQVRTGAEVAAVLKLEEILPDSIVLSHRGTEFRLRALNSWINL